MLVSLYVRDFAIVGEAELEFRPGLTVITGETGAGKSLLVDALLLLSGARGDAGAVRHGAERAELRAEFALDDSAGVRALLKELELDAGDECRLRRVLRSDGSSRAFINDSPVTLQTLKSIGQQLVEIHGQHEHQALLSRARQLALLDAYASLEATAAGVADAAQRWRTLNNEIAALSERAGTSGEMLDLMRFQLEELTRHAISASAWQELENEHRRLSHAGELIKGCADLAQMIDGEHDCTLRSMLTRAISEIDRLAQLDRRLAPMSGALNDAVVQIDEAMSELQRYLGAQDLDPDRLVDLDAQITRLHDLARKHRVGIVDLVERAAQLKSDYESLAGAGARLDALRTASAQALTAYDGAAAQLTAARSSAATRLDMAVTGLMAELGMAGGRFSTEIQTDAKAAPSATGRDQLEFLVSANAGQPVRALRKVASGGELARISLAIEVAALGQDDIASMIFDEVDVGIGGAVAEVVGRKLKQLASARQVLCVTHLPQVAAQADQHISVTKRNLAGQVHTTIANLDAKARVEEVARMLGGIEITRETRAHAADMLRRAAQPG